MDHIDLALATEVVEVSDGVKVENGSAGKNFYNAKHALKFLRSTSKFLKAAKVETHMLGSQMLDQGDDGISSSARPKRQCQMQHVHVGRQCLFQAARRK